MRTISDHIYDLVQNSIRAKASKIYVGIFEDKKKNELRILVSDNGEGIPKEHLENVRDPFFTTHHNREKQVGLGIPLLDAACNRCNGRLEIESQINEGTKILAIMEHDNIDRPPMGDLVGTFGALFTLPNCRVNWKIEHVVDERRYRLTNAKLEARIQPKRLDDFSTWGTIKKIIREKEEGLTTDRKKDKVSSKKEKKTVKGKSFKSIYG